VMAEDTCDDRKIDFYYQILTVKYDGGNMLWGEFFWQSIGLIIKIDGIINVVKYKNILSEHFLMHKETCLDLGFFNKTMI